MATSVTNAPPVVEEKAAQQVAAWSAILVLAATVKVLSAERARVAEPKEASVAKRLVEFGISAVPKRTAVPAGEERISFIETRLFTTGKTEMNPVLLSAGSPFTVVISAVESLLKKVWDTVFVGPTGGVVWLRLKARKEVSRGVRPLVGHIE